MYAKREGYLSYAPKMKAGPEKRNRNTYCHYHNDHGHDTEECMQLKNDIEDLIKRDHLRRYIDKKKDDNPKDDQRSPPPTSGISGGIQTTQVVVDGQAAGVSSSAQRKNYVRAVNAVEGT